MAAVWVAPFDRLIVRVGPVPGQRAAGGFVLDRLHGRFGGLRRLVSQGPAQVALLGDRQRGEEHLFADDVDDPGSLQRLVHVVLHPSQAQVDAAIGELRASSRRPSAAVMSISTLASTLSTNHRTGESG